MSEISPKIDFSQLLSALADQNQPFPSKLLPRFSDLSRHDIKEIEKVWPQLDTKRKVSVLEDLEDLAEDDMLVNFDDFAMAILSDPDPMVRVIAIRLLSECERPALVTCLTDLMIEDSNDAVRAAAASNLGRFVLLGELDSIPETLKIANIQNLLDVVNGHDLPQVRRRALESLGYSCHPAVPELLQKAYDSKDILWVASALYAMGRSADDRWIKHVMKKIDSPDLEVQYEAIRAAGELEIRAAKEIFFDMLDDEVEGQDIRFAIVWSLSQLGGDDSKQKLEQLLDESEDADEINLLERALENIELSGEVVEGLDLMDFDLPGAKEEHADSIDEDEEQR